MHSILSKRILVIGVLISLAIGLFFVFDRSAQPTLAEQVVHDPQSFVQKLKEYFEELRKTKWKQAAITALDKAAQQFVNRIAQQTAEYIAGGGPGQTSLQRRESFGAIIRKSGEAAIGDFVQDLSEQTQLNELGLNLCNPSAQLKANISLQILDVEKPPEPTCNIREIQDNWKRFAGNIGVNYDISAGSQYGFSASVIAPGYTGGYCEQESGQCDFPGATNTYPGVCGTGSSSNQTSVSQQVFCTTDADCGAAGPGAICVPYADSCTSSDQCTVAGTQCVKEKAGSCGVDADCAPGFKCIGGGKASPGVPWLDITKEFTPSEKLKHFNDLFSPEQSDLGSSLAISEATKKHQELRKKYAELDAEACKGYKDSKYATLGNDSDYVKRTCDEIERLDEQSGEKSHTTKDVVSPLYAGESAFWLNAAKIFGRSLISGLLKKYIKSGSFSLAQIGESTDLGSVRQNIVQQLRQGATSPLSFTNAVSNTIAESQKPSLDTVNNYDYITNFTICPDDRNNVELDNCTIDDNFASAIREQRTVAEAIEDGTINADLPLISNLNVSVNSDPFCIRSGYCHSNLARLRKHRVLPVGWEIAASLSPIDDPITLREAVNCYENNGTCKLDPQSNIYYHLIDPTWVLKAPEAQCKALTYGPKLIDVGVNERQRYCADAVSCLAEDDQGNCIGGYGYCTKEKAVWRFAGSQCPKQFASCEVYNRTVDGQSSAYLNNTLNLCDSSQNGCRWYSTSQDNVGSVANPVLAWNPQDRIYLNRQAQRCEADQVGCTEYISLVTPGVNLIPNGDFDIFTAHPSTNFADPNWSNDLFADRFDGWQGTPTTTLTTRDNAYYGTVGLRMHVPAGVTGGRLTTNVNAGILADKVFTLSWLGKSDAACTTDVAIGSLSTPPQSTTVTSTPEWKRYEIAAKFDVNNLDTSMTISFDSRCQNITGAGLSDYYIDGVKLELNQGASGFSAYGEGGKVYGRSKFQCTKEDVGCDRFRPTDGGASIPGRVDSGDLCPAECVGYQNYLELTSYFDILEAAPAAGPAARSENFIATTAAQCPATAVDCEEFTNLEEVAQGGEGRYYFNSIRQCVEDALGETFYTLEGSDTTGYQVRTWRLLKSNVNRAAGSTAAPNGGNGPCTNVDIGGKTCIDTLANTTATTCGAGDLQSNLNCREFFDVAGNPHYILQDRVIVASDDCQTYRRSSSGNTFFILKSESRTCQAEFNGCREYRGNQSGNVRTLFFDAFESGTIEPWSSQLSTISSQAVTTGGHSIANVDISGAVKNQISRSNLSLQVEANRELYMEFWMKNEKPVTLTVSTGSGSAVFAPLTVPVASDWQAYRIGPLYVGAAFTSKPVITVGAIPSSDPTPRIYLDNIILKQSISNSYLIQNTWKTPASCDEPVPGAMLGCQTYTNTAGSQYNLKSFSRLCSEEVIGCQAFIDTRNSADPFQRTYHENDPSAISVPEDSITYFVYKPENLCFPQSKGCQELGAPQLNLDLPETHPQYISGYSIETIINNPDQYDQILCTHDGLLCEEYTTTRGTSVYFKDPLNRTCAYKENINVAGQLFTGWFRTESLDSGLPIGCSDDGALPYDASDFDLYSNLDFKYDGWAAQCSSQYDRCTEFKDPVDTQGENALTNPEFAQAPGWTAFPQFGNIFAELDGNGGPNDLFEVNSGLQYGISRVSPKGTATLRQTFKNIDSTDVFSYSVDVNVRKMPDDPKPGVRANLICFWESQTDEDYCAGNGRFDYNSPCINGTATVCPIVGYTCSQDRTLSLSYCNNTVTGERTGRPCVNNNDCPANNVCEVFGNNRADANRDQKIVYAVSADAKKLNTWQNLHRSVDLGFEGNGKQLVGCDFELYQERAIFDSTNTRSSDGLACGSAPSFGGDELRPECRDTFCVDASGKADATPVRCTADTYACSAIAGNDCSTPALFKNCIVAGGTCTVTASTCPANYTCGGVSEVWWSNPSFKVAKGYFYLDDDQIDSTSCAGQVGKRDGCLMFLDVNQRANKLYDSYATYQQSANNNGGLVSPTACDPNNASCKNDANRILKVVRDRQCQEWLACRSTTEVFDESTGSYRQLCDQVGVCDEYAVGTETLSCAHWVTPDTQRLEYGVYTNRGFSDNPIEYTGYSMYNTYGVGTMELVDVSNNGLQGPLEGPDPKNQDFRLVKVIDVCDSANAYEEPCGPVDPLNTSDRLGRCFSPNKCVVGIDGSHFSRNSDYVIKSTTRAWAEKDAPFPYSVIQSDNGNSRTMKFGFQEANVCDSKYASCETRYYKFRYGATSGITKYYSTDVNFLSTAIPSCVCQGGKQDGRECLSQDFEGALGCTNNLAQRCETDSQCGKGNKCVETGDGKLSTQERCPDNGNPLYLKRAESFINLPGYCLEQDNRTNINGSQQERACLSWLPIDNSPVGYDFYNQNREAGYSYKLPAYYCLEVGLYEKRTRYYLGEKCSVRCNARDQKVDSDYRVVDRGRFGSHCRGLHRKTHCWAVPKGGPGLYSYDGDTVYNEKLPDASCVVLGQAVNERGDNAAKTNLFWSEYNNGFGYKLGDRPYVTNPVTPAAYALKYGLTQDDTPFGSAVPTGLGFITEKLAVRPNTDIPRAGSPYACSSSTQSCAYFDENSGSPMAVKGWKNPYTSGGEFYDTGVKRLKELYQKIFNLYRWREGDACDFFVCNTGYFGGKTCETTEANACNAESNPANPMATRCEAISNKCVNSVFNSSDAASALYGGCATCPAGFHTETRPDKRCESDSKPFPLNETTCPTADMDPGPLFKTCAELGYACAEDPAVPGSWRCYSDRFEGNDCKIPMDASGAPVASSLECRYNASAAESTCYYEGLDTGVTCETTSDCTAKDDGIEDNFIGELASINKTSYCADNYEEGTHDFGAGSFCVGQPFTGGFASGFDYSFEYGPVHCEPDASVTNELGEVLTGADICTTKGSCVPAYTVKYKPVPPATEGAPVCTLEPTGYLPMCVKTASNPCTGIPADRIIDTTAGTTPPGLLPLDETAKEDPVRSPYIIPVICDDAGVNCTQSKKTADFVLPTDNAFSVNNQTGSAAALQGFQNFLVTLRFYMGADKNHLPIRYIDIDWGDGLRQSRQGYYKNHMQECVDPQTALGPRNGRQEPLEYAASPEACREGFRNYLHVYTYDQKYACGRCSTTNVECGRDEDCSAGEQCNNAASSNASCYRPWVMVQDNWGWCTNNVYGVTGLGCKDPQILGGVAPAPANASAGYVKFPGIIKVYKDPKP